jgi:hypothetical protein
MPQGKKALGDGRRALLLVADDSKRARDGSAHGRPCRLEQFLE